MTSISKGTPLNHPYSFQFPKLQAYRFEKVEQNSPFTKLAQDVFKQKAFEFETKSYLLLFEEKKPRGFLVCEKKAKHEGEISVLALHRFCLNFSVGEEIRNGGLCLIGRAKKIAEELGAGVIHLKAAQKAWKVPEKFLLRNGFSIHRKGEGEELLVCSLSSQRSKRKRKRPPAPLEGSSKKRRRLAPQSPPLYSTTARKAFEQAQIHLDKEEIKSAAAHIEKSLRRYKDIICMLQIKKKNAYACRTEMSGDRQFLNKAAEEFPSKDKITFSSSLEEREKWLALFPCTAQKGAGSYFNQGTQEGKRGNNKGMFENYAKACELEQSTHKRKLHPHVTEAFVNRGYAKYRNGQNGNPDVDKALEYSEALLIATKQEREQARILSDQIQTQLT